MTDAPARPVAAIVVMATLLGFFVARPLLIGMTPLVILFLVLLAVGLAWPVVRDPRPPARVAAAVLLAGAAAFGIGRLLGGGRPPVPARPEYVAAVTLAAVAEEVFFRRFVYGVLRSGGAALAVGGSAVLFAIAHVTVYGWWVLPIDLAAGLLLAWQRWATGSWTVPAATHVVANLLIIL